MPSKNHSREKVARRYRAMHERDAAASVSRLCSERQLTVSDVSGREMGCG